MKKTSLTVKRNPMKIMLIACLSLALGAAAAAPRARFISHRGESMNAPENTLAAFRAAIERGADGFELDVYLTKDDGLICLHDGTAKRTTGLDVRPRDATLAELRALDAGVWKGPQFKGERLPTLAEALALAHDGFEIYVEIKCGREIMPRLVEAMAAEPKATPERVVFICFDAQVIAALRRQFPAYRAYWLTTTGPKKDGTPGPTAEAVVAAAKACQASGVDAQNSVDITPAFVKAVKAAGLSLHIWTVNNASRARELAAMGVETVTSDCGAALKRALYGEPPDGQPVIR
jgi:glycerophosphoryl diester phosphodiesterase